MGDAFDTMVERQIGAGEERARIVKYLDGRSRALKHIAPTLSIFCAALASVIEKGSHEEETGS